MRWVLPPLTLRRRPHRHYRRQGVRRPRRRRRHHPALIREARENALKAGVADKVKFLQQDLFETDIREATVVTLYLLPEVNRRLRPKLLAI